VRNLFEPASKLAIMDRIARLTPESERKWGSMTVAQMLAHCSAWMEMATGQTKTPRSFIGRIFGRLAKKSILADGPLRKSMPTDKSLLIKGDKDFATEQRRLLDWVERFPTMCIAPAPHSFFGRMTPMEWSTMGYKHLDHHLAQFGV
jgi:hypothetical protein